MAQEESSCAAHVFLLSPVISVLPQVSNKCPWLLTDSGTQKSSFCWPRPPPLATHVISLEALVPSQSKKSGVEFLVSHGTPPSVSGGQAVDGFHHICFSPILYSLFPTLAPCPCPTLFHTFCPLP